MHDLPLGKWILIRMVVTRRVVLLKQGDQEAKPEKCAQLSSLLMSSNLVPKLIVGLEKLPFEVLAVVNVFLDVVV